MGADIGGDYKGGIGSPTGGASIPDPVLNSINNGIGAVANDTTQQQTPQVNWGTLDTTQAVADPNNSFQPTYSGMGSPGFNPNTDMNAGVPIANTPAVNQQGAPSFALNMPYQVTPDPKNIMDSIVRSMGMSS